MGTSYCYVNFTRKEYVEFHLLRGGGGGGEGAAIRCSVALSWLMLWPTSDGYRGRWHAPIRERGFIDSAAHDRGPVQDIRIVGDGVMDFSVLEDDYLNISFGVLQSMRDAGLPDIDGWAPRRCDVAIVQRLPDSPGGGHRVTPDCVSAACACGWATGPICGEDRERSLELALSAHAIER